MPPDVLPPVTEPCASCGLTLVMMGGCEICGCLAWVHEHDGHDQAGERTLWRCRAARCGSGGHVIQRVRTCA